MKRMLWVGTAMVALAAMGTSALAAEGAKIWQIQNRLRVEYDDNVQQVRDELEEDSIKVIEEVEFHVNLNLENTFLGARYRPSFTWYDNRPEDETDLHHDFDFILNQRFSPRFSLSVKDVLHYVENPEVIERGVLMREKNDFFHNNLNVIGKYKVTDKTQVDFSGRWVTLLYDDEAVGAREDFDLFVAGLTAIHALQPDTTVNGELRFETIDYDTEEIDRGSQSYFASASVEQNFNPNLLGSLRAGWQHKEFEAAANADDSDSPFADVSVTLLPSPDTRLTAGAGFTQFEPNVFPYVNQERTRVFASLAHDLTAKVALYLSSTYTQGDYDGDEIADGAGREAIDGTEDILLVSSRLSYELNRSNWLDLVYQYTDFSSDLRDDYDRNRVSIGWKTKI